MDMMTLTNAERPTVVAQRGWQSVAERDLSLELYARLFVPGKPLGQTIEEAKQAYAQRRPTQLDVLAGWTLLGDPTLVVNP